MASRPNSWKLLQGAQWRIMNEVTTTAVDGGPSYFTPWLNSGDAYNTGQSDYTRYSPNVNGLITSAIYLGMPKVFCVDYPVQCHLIPSSDMVTWRSNPRVFDEINIHVALYFHYTTDWYGTLQTAMAVRDQLQVVLMRHAEMPSVAEVQAVQQRKASDGPMGWYFDEMLGRDWLCYGTNWWHRQEWSVPGGLIGA